MRQNLKPVHDLINVRSRPIESRGQTLTVRRWIAIVFVWIFIPCGGPVEARNEAAALSGVGKIMNAPQRLSLYRGEPEQETATPVESRYTLQEFWEKVMRPELTKKLSRDRVGEYQTTINRWTAWLDSHRMTYPVLSGIGPATLRGFREFCLEKLLLSVDRCNRHVRDVSALLAAAYEEQIVSGVPRLRKLAISRTERRAEAMETSVHKFIFSVEEVRAIYRAASAAVWPDRWHGGAPLADPSLPWRAFLAIEWAIGSRPADLWPVHGAPRGEELLCLRWGWVVREPEIVVDGRKWQNANGWLRLFQSKRSRFVILPLNLEMRRHIDELWEATPTSLRDADSRVWNFALRAGTNGVGHGGKKRPARASDGFYSQWRAIVSEAKQFTPISIVGEQSGGWQTHMPKHFRKTAHTMHRARIGAAANYITDHRLSTVSESAYWQQLGEVIQSINAMAAIA